MYGDGLTNHGQQQDELPAAVTQPEGPLNFVPENFAPENFAPEDFVPAERTSTSQDPQDQIEHDSIFSGRGDSCEDEVEEA